MKSDLAKRKRIVFQPPFFRGYLKLQECTPPEIHLKFNMEMMEMMGFPIGNLLFQRSIFRFSSISPPAEADIERKTGFVGSGKGLKQLVSQKAPGKIAEKIVRFFADKSQRSQALQPWLKHFLVLYDIICYVLLCIYYSFYSMYSFRLGKRWARMFWKWGDAWVHEILFFVSC